MIETVRKIRGIALVCGALLVLAACDDAADGIGEDVEDAGDAIEEGVDNMIEDTEDAADEIDETIEDATEER